MDKGKLACYVLGIVVFISLVAAALYLYMIDVAKTVI